MGNQPDDSCSENLIEHAVEEFFWRGLCGLWFTLVLNCLSLGMSKRCAAPSTTVTSLIDRAKHCAYSAISHLTQFTCSGVRSWPIVTSARMTLTRAGLSGSVFLIRSVGSKVFVTTGCSIPGSARLFPEASSKSHTEIHFPSGAFLLGSVLFPGMTAVSV
jgi:hypothetical protein